MEKEWLLLLPPMITLALAIFSRRIVLSLFCGCICSAFICTEFSVVDACKLFSVRFFETTQLNQWTSLHGIMHATNPQISLFVIAMGILIHTIEKTGGYRGFYQAIGHYVHAKQQAEFAAVALSHCVSIDGYLSTLTVGSVMRPLIDKYGSTRIKLAYIARSLAIPICSINPFSTWMALILLQLNASGIHSIEGPHTVIIADPFHVYFNIIPFMFYSLITLASVWIVVGHPFSFGAMGTFEHKSVNYPIKNRSTFNLSQNYTPYLCDFFIPLLSLVTFTFIGFLYSGGWVVMGGSVDFFTALEKSNIAPSLLFAAVLSAILYLLYMTLRKAILFKEWITLIKDGSLMMLSSIAVLNLAWTFGAIVTHSGIVQTYLNGIMPTDMQMTLLPVIFYLISAAVAMATGSSWATIALLFPVAATTIVSVTPEAMPIAVEHLPYLFPILGAVVSGAVAGDQLSPISDSSIVVTASTHCFHGDHSYSQFTYGLPVLIISALAFYISGWLIPMSPLLACIFPLFVSILITYCYFLYRQRHSRYQEVTI